MNNLMSNSFEPQLARFYRVSQAKAFFNTPRVHQNSWARFQKFEKELHEDNIPPRDYAYIVTELLRKWVHTNGFKYIPYKTFTGPWALERYKAVSNSQTVTVAYGMEVDEEELLYTELLVARTYIYKNAIERRVVRFSKVVEDMWELLNPDWVDIYDRGGKRPIAKALEILSEELGRDFDNYTDVVSYRLANG